MTPAGACRSTSASRAARAATASVSLRGRGPMKEASTCSASARSIGRPSADSSAHSSSAVDSERAVGSAIGRPGRAASAACCSPASVRASSAHRARRSARSAHPPLTHSGRRCPSGATGSSSSPSSGPDISNRSSGPPAGSVCVSRPRTRAQAQPGSARQPPNSSRCAAAMSQHVARRTPPATRCAAVWPDQTAHRGRSASSARPTSAARAAAPRGAAARGPAARGPAARGPAARAARVQRRARPVRRSPRPGPGRGRRPAPRGRRGPLRPAATTSRGPRTYLVTDRAAAAGGARGRGQAPRSVRQKFRARSAAQATESRPREGSAETGTVVASGGRFESFSARFRNAIGPGRRFRAC